MSRPNGPGGEAVPTLVYGTGDGGHQVARLIATAEDPPYRIVGFWTTLWRSGISESAAIGARHGPRPRQRGPRYGCRNRHPRDLNASPELLQKVSDRCDAAGLHLVVILPIREMIGGRVTLGSLREFNVDDLLGRRPIKTDIEEISAYITGKRVLITGAGGSIGSELARQVHALGPAKLALLDRDESALHGVQLSIYGNGLLDSDDMVLCDIRDQEALRAVFANQKPEVVFHAAALKHLPMLERYPAEGWKTNVLGTKHVLECAVEHGVTHVVNISTDKAADATSVLGQTKRLAERLTAWFAQEYGLKFLSVRFGNVLGSRGSVLHSFKAQIERGGPVTVTHPEVTRYFMTIPEACQLILQAGAIGDAGGVSVLDMGRPVKIVDVAKRLISESGKDIEIHFTGLRPGEKMHEVLFSPREAGLRASTRSSVPSPSRRSAPMSCPVILPVALR